MEIYKINDIGELITGNSYIGRGIVIGKTEDGTKAAAAYFLMGRSANSRNRIFAYCPQEKQRFSLGCILHHPCFAASARLPMS